MAEGVRFQMRRRSARPTARSGHRGCDRSITGAGEGEEMTGHSCRVAALASAHCGVVEARIGRRAGEPTVGHRCRYGYDVGRRRGQVRSLLSSEAMNLSGRPAGANRHPHTNPSA